MAAPPIANSNPTLNGVSAANDHGRKPSVTISAAGTSGYIANGGPVLATSSRRNITFGSVNASPSVVNSSLYESQHAPHNTSYLDSRITEPGKSPSPIPQPANSGGRPPSGFQPPSNGPPPTFGSMGGSEDMNNRQVQGSPMPSMPESAGLRRQSSQSTHGDMNNAAMSFGSVSSRGNTMSGSGRGGRMPSFGQGYSQQTSFSPSQGFRSMAHHRPSGTMPPYFQNHNQHGPGGSPHTQPRTPGQHSQPNTPQMQHQQMNNPMQYQSGYGGYSQHLSPQQGHYNMQSQYDPSFNYYQQASYQMPPAYLQQQIPQGAPAGSRNFRPGAPPQQPYMPGQYSQTPPPSMSRSTSQISEHRPSSTNHGPSQHPPPPPPSGNNQHQQGPSQSTASGPPAVSNFTIPKREKKGITIKRPDGEIVTFDKVSPAAVTSPAPVPSPALAPSPSPAAATSVPTPPPRTSSTTSKTPPDVKPGMTAEEIKAQFREQVKRGSQEDKVKEDEEAKAKAETEVKASKEKEEAEAKATQEKRDAEALAEKAKEDARKEAAAKEAAEKEAAEKAAAEKEAAEKEAAQKEADEKEAAQKEADKKEAAEKLAAEKQAADKLAAENQATEKEAAEKADAEKAAAAKLATEKAAADRVAAERAEAEKTSSEKATAEADGEAREDDEVEKAKKKKQEDDDAEFERMVAEMEAAEKAEQEREKAFQDKRKKQIADEKAREKERSDNPDEAMKRAEREAEAAEEARQKKRDLQDSAEAKAEREKDYASLKKPTLGPGAEVDEDDKGEDAGETGEAVNTPDTANTPEASILGLEDSVHASSKEKFSGAKPKPMPLKLETSKAIEPAQPTPGMQALKSARMLQLQTETVQYPEGIQSPNPALLSGGKRAGRMYEKDFLMQFRDAFKEKPSVDWDNRLKESVGDTSDTPSRSARGPVTPRVGSTRGAVPSYQTMGQFTGAQAIRAGPGSTSAERFAASQRSGPSMSNPIMGMGNRPGGFPMPMQANRANSTGVPPSRAGTSGRPPRIPSRTDNRSRKEDAKANAAMPLTAGADVKSLELSATGWKSASAGKPGAASAVDTSGHMAPDLVQKKVKAALNKMTPERFDKISDQILEIAAQSKDEADGRTLRQVIQLTFDKACDEAHWASMYAKFCFRMMEEMSPEIKDETILDKNGNPVVGGPLFRKYLLTRCQEDFERGWNVNLPERGEGQSEEAAMLSDEYYIAAAAKRKGLGLVQFIGELYKLRMLSIKIMHQCFMRLLDFEGMPDESAIESLVKLIRTVGSTMQQETNGPQILDQYFQRIDTITNMDDLPSRMRFMLLDTIDLRKAGWRSKDDAKGPKTIQEIHDEAAVLQAAEAQKQQSQRGGGGRPPVGRGDARNFSGPMAPPDYPRNQVATEDLRRLGNRKQASTQSQARTLGPSSMFSSRSNSGRPSALGPPVQASSNRGESGLSSRTASRTEDTPRTPTNAFSALADLDPSGENIDGSPAVSPQPKHAQPATSNAETTGDSTAPKSSDAAASGNDDSTA